MEINEVTRDTAGTPPSTNPHDWTKWSIFRPQIYLASHWDSQGLPIYSTTFVSGAEYSNCVDISILSDREDSWFSSRGCPWP